MAFTCFLHKGHVLSIVYSYGTTFTHIIVYTLKVKREVWRRDYGKCVECGSQVRLEYDHIIPFSRGGSNTARNIQLLCEKCNRKKHDKIE